MIPSELGELRLGLRGVIFAMPSNIKFQNVQSKSGESTGRPADEPLDLSRIEFELRNLWGRYVHTVETRGSNQDAEQIRARYFALYRSYRQNKQWRNILTSS